MDKEKTDRIYERLEKALLEEDCSCKEARCAVERLREKYFYRGVNKLLEETSIQKLANVDISSWNHKTHEDP